MSTFTKILDNRVKEKIFKTTGKKAKTRCPKCHNFTLFITKPNGKIKCLVCDKELN